MRPPLDPALVAALADRYHIERELGRGGMATVFLARDLRHDREVALKVLDPRLAHLLGPERFEREIRLAARLQHPHILTVHDSGAITVGGSTPTPLLWFTMPYVAGESLRDRLSREKQLPIEVAVHIARDIAGGLAYAHGQGVIHRDIKPENILLTGDEATVADFGIARALGSVEDRLTSTGLALGTPAYMSPEQASGGREVDARTDIYSLGAVLYEVLVGEPPYTGPTAQAVIAKRFTGAVPSVRQARATVPEALERVVTRALALVPADRYASATDFAAALELAIHPSAASPAVTTSGALGERMVSRTSPITTRRVTLALVAGVVLTIGALYAWRGTHSVNETGGLRRLAVLPFENLGAAEDEYFADGVTDAVRGKLAALSGLQVTARSSSIQYKKTFKTPQQIGEELGVQYLLSATVRWEKSASGESRVQVTPELIQATTASTRWQQPFDAVLSGVFQVQADIASRVAQALSVALGDSARQQLAERPTRSLAAYDAYLRGEEISGGLSALDAPTLRRAAAYYAEAVALDSTYALAWARLSLAHSLTYRLNAPTPGDAEMARLAAERALTLAPARPEGYVAFATYYSLVTSDNVRALDLITQGLSVAPNNADLLRGSGLNEAALGRWDVALTHLQRASTIDPRSVRTAHQLAAILCRLRRYSECREAVDHVLWLAPSNFVEIQLNLLADLSRGDLAGARSTLAAAPPTADSAGFVAYLAADHYWLLDDARQSLLLGLPPSAFDNNRSGWGLALASTYALRGDHGRARAYADSARADLETRIRNTPKDARSHVLLGLALAYLGRNHEAIQEGERGVALNPISTDELNGPYLQHQLARIYILAGEPEKALDQLEPLLKVPYYLSPGWLRIDPTFDSLRKNPRFQKLVAAH